MNMYIYNEITFSHGRIQEIVKYRASLYNFNKKESKIESKASVSMVKIRSYHSQQDGRFPVILVEQYATELFDI